jgi:hypothetical protein
LAGFAGCESGEDGKAHRDDKKSCKREGKSRGKNRIGSGGCAFPEAPKDGLFTQLFRPFEGSFTDALEVSLGRLDLGSFAEKFAEEFVRRYGRLHFAE